MKTRSKARYWWLALLGICLVPCVTPFTCSSDPNEFMARVPENSRLSDLDQHIGKFSGRTRVLEWTRERTPDSTERPVEFKHGSFYVRELGDYQNWSASQEIRDRFSGEIKFELGSWINLDNLAPVYHVSLFYVDGVLKEKYLARLAG